MQQVNKDIQLSAIISVYNEPDTIRQIIDSVLSVDAIEKEIIIVDDCSNDGTRDILKKEIESTVSKVIYHEINQGKGAAIRTALKHVTGLYTIIQDEDLEYNPKEYPVLQEPIVNGKADVVLGSRFITTEHRRVLYFWHYKGRTPPIAYVQKFENIVNADAERVGGKAATLAKIMSQGFPVPPDFVITTLVYAVQLARLCRSA